MGKITLLNSVFKYKADPTNDDNWRVMDLGVSSEGDCEDYALTALFYLCDKSWFKFWFELVTGKSKIHYVTLWGAGHAVLEYDGLYIDNTKMTWMNKTEFNNYFTPVSKFSWMKVAKRLWAGRSNK